MFLRPPLLLSGSRTLREAGATGEVESPSEPSPLLPAPCSLASFLMICDEFVLVVAPYIATPNTRIKSSRFNTAAMPINLLGSIRKVSAENTCNELFTDFTKACHVSFFLHRFFDELTHHLLGSIANR